MNVGDSVACAIDDFEAKKIDSSLLHACNAVDGTASKLARSKQGNKERFTAFLRDYYWLLEPMVTPGINLVDTRFGNISLANNPAPDLADIVYKEFRCRHAHGQEVPPNLSLLRGPRITEEGPFQVMALGEGILNILDSLCMGLVAAAVLSPENRDQTTTPGHWFSLGGVQYSLNEWWGRAEDFRPIAASHNLVRVKLEGLEDWS